MKLQRGFTLIEIIAVLLLVSVLAAGAGLFLVNAVEGYLFAEQNAEMTLKLQNGLERLAVELRDATVITAPTSSGATTTISFKGVAGSPPPTKTVDLAGNTLRITGCNPTTGASLGSTPTLVDRVQSFSVAVVCANLDPSREGNEVRSVDIALTLEGISNAFTTKVYPRNLLTCPY